MSEPRKWSPVWSSLPPVRPVARGEALPPVELDEKERLFRRQKYRRDHLDHHRPAADQPDE